MRQEQSFEQGVAILCDRAQVEPIVAGAPFAEWPAKLAAWNKITNAQAKAVVASLATEKPLNRWNVLSRAGGKAKVQGCATQGLFTTQKLQPDPRDDAAATAATKLAQQQFEAFMGRPFDAALQAESRHSLAAALATPRPPAVVSGCRA